MRRLHLSRGSVPTGGSSSEGRLRIAQPFKAGPAMARRQFDAPSIPHRPPILPRFRAAVEQARLWVDEDALEAAAVAGDAAGEVAALLQFLQHVVRHFAFEADFAAVGSALGAGG